MYLFFVERVAWGLGRCEERWGGEEEEGKKGRESRLGMDGWNVCAVCVCVCVRDRERALFLLTFLVLGMYIYMYIWHHVHRGRERMH